MAVTQLLIDGIVLNSWTDPRLFAVAAMDFPCAGMRGSLQALAVDGFPFSVVPVFFPLLVPGEVCPADLQEAPAAGTSFC